MFAYIYIHSSNTYIYTHTWTDILTFSHSHILTTYILESYPDDTANPSLISLMKRKLVGTEVHGGGTDAVLMPPPSAGEKANSTCLMIGLWSLRLCVDIDWLLTKPYVMLLYLSPYHHILQDNTSYNHASN